MHLRKSTERRAPRKYSPSTSPIPKGRRKLQQRVAPASATVPSSSAQPASPVRIRPRIRPRNEMAERLPRLQQCRNSPCTNESSTRRSSKRSVHNELDEADPASPSEFSPVHRPAAFPTLAQGGTQSVQDGRHGIARLIQQRCLGSDEHGRSCSIDEMHALYKLIFPDGMEEDQKSWYIDLSTKTTGHGETNITFNSLCHPLRQTIICEICEEVDGTYPFYFYPATCLLRISHRDGLAAFKDYSCHEIPEFLHKLRKQSPGMIVDPDMPPPTELVRAILYLRQERLPASLLSDWQFPQPSQADFDLVTGISTATITRGSAPAGGLLSSTPPPPPWSPITPPMPVQAIHQTPHKQSMAWGRQSPTSYPIEFRNSHLQRTTLPIRGHISRQTYPLMPVSAQEELARTRTRSLQGSSPPQQGMFSSPAAQVSDQQHQRSQNAVVLLETLQRCGKGESPLQGQKEGLVQIRNEVSPYSQHRSKSGNQQHHSVNDTSDSTRPSHVLAQEGASVQPHGGQVVLRSVQDINKLTGR